jgi:hypothetical protein
VTVGIYLKVGRTHFALVDAEDYSRLSRYRWYLNTLSDGTKWAYRYDLRGPARASGRRSKIQLSHEVTGLGVGGRVRHANRDRLDCRKENLSVREGTVTVDPRMRRKQFKVTVCVDYRNYFIGHWPNRKFAEHAIELATPAVREMRGKGLSRRAIERTLREAVGIQ